MEKDRFLKKETNERVAYINADSTQIIQLLSSLFLQGICRMKKEKHKANAKIQHQKNVERSIYCEQKQKTNYSVEALRAGFSCKESSITGIEESEYLLIAFSTASWIFEKRYCSPGCTLETAVPK